jgi:hypothetical protein
MEKVKNRFTIFKEKIRSGLSDDPSLVHKVSAAIGGTLGFVLAFYISNAGTEEVADGESRPEQPTV